MNTIMNENSLTVLKNLYGDPLVYTLLHSGESHSAFLGELYSRGGECNLLGLLSKLIIRDVNALSLSLARGKTPSPYVADAFASDVRTILNAAERAAARGGFNLGKTDEILDDLNKLGDFYKNNGYGIFIDNIAFDYDGDGLVPIKKPSKTRLYDLKDYENEKKSYIFNIENFIKGLPCGNVLLYGDRGTGKSSTVRAALNEYAQNGLRLIQLDKKYLDRLPAIRNLVEDNPLKFIIFIDDLTLTQETPSISSFKAALEGSLSSSQNTIIVATSNRRHIVKESYADRQNDLHPEDGIQDSISLSDRFAVTIMFSSTGKTEYLSIVSQLAKESGIYFDGLCSLAERWALLRGGRSPRTAKQFCDYALSCTKRGLPIDF